MARKMKLDFTGVESFQRASEGKHVCRIVSADEKASQGGNDMIVVAFEVTKGDDKGARVYENYPLVDTALWKLKGLLQAIGMKADGKVQLDLDKLIGKQVTVTVKHEEYEGKTRARVDEVSKLTAASADADEDEDSDSEAEDEQDEEEEQEEKKPAKKEKAPAKKGKKAPMPEPEDEDEDEEEEDDEEWDEDEEDEEEEEKPAPKKKDKPKAEKPAKKEEKKPAKKSKKSDDDDDDWDEEDWDE